MKGAAVIVETRPLPNLDKIILQHMRYLGKEWKLYIFTSQFHELKNLKSPNTVFYEDINVSTEWDYNLLLTMKEFWDRIEEEKILIFQYDSRILREGIDEFLDYDFIGAPLYHIPFPAMNGGFSLRSKSIMKKILNEFPYRLEFGNEDVYFCNNILRVFGKLPTFEKAKLFSVETIFSLGSLGVHAIEKWHSVEKCNLILSQYEK